VSRPDFPDPYSGSKHQTAAVTSRLGYLATLLENLIAQQDRHHTELIAQRERHHLEQMEVQEKRHSALIGAANGKHRL